MFTAPPAQERRGKAVSTPGAEYFERSVSHWLADCLRFGNTTGIAYFQDCPPAALILASREEMGHENVEKIYPNNAHLFDPFHELHTQEALKGCISSE